jgi:hypothetical protein
VRTFVVRWEIEIDGVDSKDAAINAFNTLYDIQCCFKVQEKGSRHVETVDLSKLGR